MRKKTIFSKSNRFEFLVVPLHLTIITYTTRYVLKKDLYTCWFEPSMYDWIIHGPNVVLQIVIRKRNFSVFILIFDDLVEFYYF
jgi:hypothetical protein